MSPTESREDGGRRPTFTTPELILLCHDGVVDILFLRRMDAHQGLNRLDHTLGVANDTNGSTRQLHGIMEQIY